MAYDLEAARALREALAGMPGIEERKMFGGICFLHAGNMLCGIGMGGYMFRVGKVLEAEALARPGAAPMVLGGRPMGGIIHVDIAAAGKLESWLALAFQFVGELPAKTT